ncbi:MULTISPECIES: sugar kinase [Halocynthiibacter]|uniref:Sugar kinase n=1 Tax=Halocynthiibacter halioticoli TaxID=2986804 RepID=A0AAE3J2A9_9RHOB|nr:MULTISPECIES: sugar kinase [Halocynthiibacter]MCV6825353.1 sugar kinase [Halocynthiibacter halioticoli]MCW4058354.1 sugar kinase [Halocynthiibacter sp. SDUM655004]
MTNKTFLSIGEAMIEMAVVGPDTYRRGFAGDTFNTAWYLAKLLPTDWGVKYFSGLGVDAASNEMREFAKSSGIDMSPAREVAEKTVGLYMIHLDGGERSFSYWRSDSAARQMAGDVDYMTERFMEADVLFFSGISLAVVLPEHRAAFLEAIGKARAAGKTTIFDPNQRLRLWKDQTEMSDAISDAAKVSEIILPSFDEEQQFYGDTSPEATIERYFAAGVNTVIVKNGPGLVTAQTKGEAPITVQPNIVENVVDTTAAGDSFNAGFCAALLQGADLASAITSGAELAGKVVTSHGALVNDAV